MKIHSHKVVIPRRLLTMSRMKTMMKRRPLFACSVMMVLQLFSHAPETRAFVPLMHQKPRRAPTIGGTLFSSSQSLETATSTPSQTWIKEEIEKHNIKGEDLIDKESIVGPKHVLIYDTTLRDGTQGESVSASCDDKLKITQRLAKFGVDYIEAGWPGSNPKDAEFFERAKTELSPEIRSKLVAFGSTRRKNVAVEDDAQIEALLESEAPTVCLVAKAHKWQVTDILRATPKENLEMIQDSVAYLTSKGRRVFVDLEHFYDGYKYDEQYALQCCEAAADSGAKCLVLCDTNGGSMPWQVESMTRKVVQYFDHYITVGVHTHNDAGMAVANSLSACKAGAGLVQGTINGIGERTGNADLCSIVPSLALHMDSRVHCREQLSDISSLSRFVDEILNRTPNHAAPYVGTSAFAHKGGLHVAAMERSPLSYQHVDPAQVGNEKRVLISELSGRQNIMGKLKDAGIVNPEDASARATAILNRVKRLESKGYTFEGAEASVHLMILHATTGYCPPFRVLDYSAQVYDSHIDSASRVLEMERRTNSVDGITSPNQFLGPTARATVKVRTLNLDEEAFLNEKEPLMYKDRLEVSDGSGPVDALAKALKRALLPSHPYLKNVELADYKVRILDPESATGAATRVMIEFRDSETDENWTTVSVDRNIISASVNALVDGFEYALVEHASSCVLCDDAFPDPYDS